MTPAGIEAFLHSLDTFAAVVIAPLIGVCGYYLRRTSQRLEHIEIKLDALGTQATHVAEWRENHVREDDDRFATTRAQIARVETRLDAHVARTANGIG